jgi:hypothetical protein
MTKPVEFRTLTGLPLPVMCERCGALVTDNRNARWIHSQWHSELAAALPPASE